MWVKHPKIWRTINNNESNFNTEQWKIRKDVEFPLKTFKRRDLFL